MDLGRQKREMCSSQEKRCFITELVDTISLLIERDTKQKRRGLDSLKKAILRLSYIKE